MPVGQGSRKLGWQGIARMRRQPSNSGRPSARARKRWQDESVWVHALAQRLSPAVADQVAVSALHRGGAVLSGVAAGGNQGALVHLDAGGGGVWRGGGGRVLMAKHARSCLTSAASVTRCRSVFPIAPGRAQQSPTDRQHPPHRAEGRDAVKGVLQVCVARHAGLHQVHVRQVVPAGGRDVGWVIG